MAARNHDRGTPATDHRPIWLYVVCILIIMFLIAPSVIVIPMSFSQSKFLTFPPQAWSLRWYEDYFSSLEWRDATIISVKAAVGTTVLATVFGTMAAYGTSLARGPIARVVRVLFILPIAIPVILVAVGAFLLYAKLALNNTLTGLVLAHTCLALPLVFVTVGSAFKHYDFNQEMVARSLGASRLVAFLTVTLPQIKLSVLSGAVLSFITSLDEVVVALFVSSGDQSTLTRRMFTSLRDEVDPTIAAISSVLIIISVTLLGGTSLLQRLRK